MSMVQIKTPRSDDAINFLTNGRNYLNTTHYNRNCTTSEYIQCYTSNEILKHKLVIDENIEEWSIIEKRNQVSKSSSISNYFTRFLIRSFETIMVIDLH